MTVFKDYYLGTNANINVHVYSPDIPVGSADGTIYTSNIDTYSFTVSSLLGRNRNLQTLLQLSIQFSFLFHQVPIIAE